MKKLLLVAMSVFGISLIVYGFAYAGCPTPEQKSEIAGIIQDQCYIETVEIYAGFNINELYRVIGETLYMAYSYGKIPVLYIVRKDSYADKWPEFLRKAVPGLTVIESVK